MRLFIAVNLPSAERARAYRALALLRAAGLPVRWVAEESLHLTLKFLGEVGEAAVGAVEGALGLVGARHATFRLSLGGAGAFPALRRPRVLWIGVEGSEALQALQCDVEGSLALLGFSREGREYSPHLTVGRVERDARAAAFAGLETLARDIAYRAIVEIGSVDLMRSFLSGQGARYERVAAVPLTGKGSGQES